MNAAKDAPLAGGNAPLGILVVNNVPSAFQNLSCSYSGAQLTPPPVTCMSLLQSTGQFLAANPNALLTQGPNFAAITPDW